MDRKPLQGYVQFKSHGLTLCVFSPYSQQVQTEAGLWPHLEETPGGFIWRLLFLPFWSPSCSLWTNRLLL